MLSLQNVTEYTVVISSVDLTHVAVIAVKLNYIRSELAYPLKSFQDQRTASLKPFAATEKIEQSVCILKSFNLCQCQKIFYLRSQNESVCISVHVKLIKLCFEKCTNDEEN